MDRKSILIIAAVVLAAVILAAVSFLMRPQVDTDVVIISVNGSEYARIPLGTPQTVTIRQDDGAVNVVEITADGAVMRSSTCDNQLCVDMGWVTRENWEFRPNGAFIICLPNRVSVELAVKE